MATGRKRTNAVASRKRSRRPAGPAEAPPPADSYYAPKGDEADLDNAFTLAAKFGPLRPGDASLIKQSIVGGATHLNRLLSDHYKGPARSKILKELEGVALAASGLAEALGTLHTVTLAWLTGGAVTGRSLDLYVPFRYLPARRRGRGARDVSDFPQRGPLELQKNEAFVEAFDGVFELELLKLERDIKRRREKIAAQTAEVDNRMESARFARDYEAARADYFKIELEFERQRDLIDPMTGRLGLLAKIAELAKAEVIKRWPVGGGADPLALVSPQLYLAQDCWDMITCFFGPDGVAKIKQTPNGLFGLYVKAVACYAVGIYPEGSKFDLAIKDAAIIGREFIKRREDEGQNPYLAYTFSRERFGR